VSLRYLRAMRRFLSILVSLTTSLWLGGLVMLFIAVPTLFQTFAAARPVAGNAAAGIFHAFERYQLILAAIGLIATFGWRVTARKRTAMLKTVCFTLLSLATVAAAGSTLFVTPKIDAMRLRGETYGPAFGRLHGISMSLYVAESVLLLIAGLLLPSIIARDGGRG
jgi:hypothetical protein